MTESRRARLESIAQLQPRNFDGIVDGHELQQFMRDAVRAVLETAVALAVTRDIQAASSRIGSAVASRFRRCLRRAVDSFAGRIADGIVGPGRELIFVAVERPCEARAGFGDHEIRNDGLAMTLIQGCGRAQPSLRTVDVFAAVRGKAANPLKNCESRGGDRGVRIVWRRDRPRAAAKARRLAVRAIG